VMRELEGRSYTEIADRLEMSLPMVESTLFRARRKLGQEYDQIASGARCSQVCAVIDGVQSASSAAGRRKALGTRDSRTLLRHVAHCQACRRHAFVTGFDLSQLRTGDLARRIAALLPFPFVKRLFEGGSGALRGHSVRATAVEDLVRTAGSSGPAVLEASRTAAALIAVALTGAGAGLVVHDSGGLQAATARTIAQAPPSGGLGAFGLGLPLQAVSRQFVTAIKIAPPVVAGSVITNPFIPSLYSGQLGTIPLGPWQARGPAATPGESSLQVPTTPADATAGADGKSSAGPAGASANAGSGQPADANGTPNTGKNAQSTQQSSGSATSSGKDTGATRGSGSPTGANAMGGGSSSSQPKSTGHTSRTPAPKVTKPGDARQARTSTTGGAGSGAAQQTGGSDGTDQPAPGGPGAGPQGNAVGQTDPGASSPSPGNNNAESPPAQSANDGADNGTSTDSSRPSLSTTAADLRAVSSTIDTISLGAASTAGPDTAHGAAKSS